MKAKCCWYCGRVLNARSKKLKPTRDHQLPKCRGGKNNDDNKVWACSECNQDKGNLTVEEYRIIKIFRAGTQITIKPKDIIKFNGEKERV